MNRTTTRLKRLGIGAVAVAAIGAGVPVLATGTAQAAGGPTNQLAITPSTQTGTAGSCLSYTVTATDNGTKPSDTPTVTVTLTQSTASTGTIGFCDPNATTKPGTPGNPVQSPATGTSTTAATTTKNFSTTVSPNGTVSATFGVYSSNASTVNIRAALTSNAAIQSNTATATFSAASPSPSPSPSRSASPPPTSPPAGRQTLTLVTTTPDIQPNQTAILIARGAANAVIELRCYSRPSTTYFTARVATINATGDAVTFRLLPGTNTRCFVQYQTNPNTGFSPSVVVNVHTTLSLSAIRNGVRNYTFQGRNLPRRAGQLITLYRISGGTEIRTAIVYTDATGTWYIRRQFTGTGTFGFRVRTSQNLTNAAGVSYVYTVNIH